MQKFVSVAFSALLLVAASSAWSHPATERYIPIGKSPGVSGVKSYIGAIRSVRQIESGFSMLMDDTEQEVDFDKYTKIYLDRGPGKENQIGTEADCKVGRTVEVYLHENGVAYWVKIKAP